VKRIKLVWMQREDRGRGSAAQRGKSAAREGGSQKEVRRTFKMLREV